MLTCDPHSLARAAEALPLPLQPSFYAAVLEQPLSSEEVSRNTAWCCCPLSANAIEDCFIWLIRVGAAA